MNKCVDCGKIITGHNNSKRCRSCAGKYSWKTGARVRKFNINPNDLRQLYIKDKLSTLKIAKKLNMSSVTVWYYLIKYNIPRRSTSEAGVGRFFNIECRKKLSKTMKGRHAGKNHPRFKGRIRNTDGYIMIFLPNHPNRTKSGHVREHRLVIEANWNHVSLTEWIGFGWTGKYPKNVRFLTAIECVHHENGITGDNRLENLRVFQTQQAHLAYHRELKRQEKNGIQDRVTAINK